MTCTIFIVLVFDKVIQLLKISIAWLQLKYYWRQSIAGAVGIFCITFLLFIQLGLRDAFLEGALQLPLNFDAHIVAMSALSATALQPVAFPFNSLYQSLGLQEIESVSPVYIASTQWLDRERSLFRIRVNVIGIPTHIQTLNLPGVSENLWKLNRRGFSLFDRNARHEFSSIIKQVKEQGDALAEIRSGTVLLRQLRVVGLFELGVNNAYDATFLTGSPTFIDLFDRQENSIDIGLIKMKDDSDPITIKKTVIALRKYLPKEVKILSKSELIKQERIFHENNSPIGFIFRFILIIAVVISIFVLYQIFYVRVSNNLENYATLKALGFSQVVLFKIVVQEALALGIIGYVPGILISSLTYVYLARVTKIVISMNLRAASIVFSLVILICLVSASLALIRLKDADPIDLFS